MSNNPSTKPSGKILFGVDYLNLMSWMELPGDDEKPDKYHDFGPITYAMAQLFLLQWDFSIKEIDEANRIFNEKIDSNTLDENLSTVIDRLAKFIKDDKSAVEKLITEMTAIAHMDQKISRGENWLADVFKETFDLAPSEFRRLDQRGIDWAIALDYLGGKFIALEKVQKIG